MAATLEPPRTVLRTAPLSFLQEQLWLVEQIESGDALYNEVLGLRLCGALDAEALERAIGAVVERHASLRTTVRTEAGEPVQEVWPPAPVALGPAVDHTHLGPAERLTSVEAAGRELAEAPYDLEHGPLVRWALHRLAPDEHLLLVAVHHIVSDGESMDVLVRDLDRCYAAFAAGTEPDLPAVGADYLDFALWQRDAVQAGRLDAEAAYWADALRGAPTVLELPADRPRPERRSAHGRREAFPLDAASRAAVERLAGELGCTRFNVLLGVFAALLQRYTGQEDVIVGSGASGRPGTRFERTFGLFANMVALRLRPAADAALGDVIRATAETAFDALDHQLLPFEKVVELLRPERDPSRPPVVQVVFTMWDAGPRETTVGDLRACVFDVPRGRSRFDLLVEVVTAPGRLDLVVEYDSDLFERETVARMVDHYERLLGQAAADPATTVAGARMLAEGELDALTRDGAEVRDGAGNVVPPGAVGELHSGGAPTGRLARRRAGGAIELVEAAAEPAPDLDGELPPLDENAALESVLTAIWSDVLDLDRVDRDDDFFALGGHSMAASRVARQVEAALGVEVPLATIFDCCTVAELAAELAWRHPGLEAEAEAAAGDDGGGGGLASEPPPAAGPASEAALTAPMSASQLQVWVGEQLGAGEVRDYVAALAYRVRGPLDAAALEGALTDVAARHELLRASVSLAGDVPVLRIAPEAHVALPVDDLAPLAPAMRDDAAARIVQAEAEQPFDLARGPLLRARLLRLAPDDHTLLLVQHHLITDAVAMEVLTRELDAHYAARVRGTAAAARPLAVGYGDYVVWEREWLAGPDAERARRFWRDRLAGAPELRLGDGRVGERRTSSATATRSRTLGPEPAAGIERLGRTARASGFMVVTAALAATLADWSGQDDVVIGTTVENRPLPGLHDVVGCCVNVVALRVDCGGDPTFGELVARVRQAVLDAHAHQALPFGHVVSALGLPSVGDRTPVFQVTSEWVDRRQVSLALEGCVVAAEPVPMRTLRYELALYASRERDTVALELEYATDLWDPAAIDARLAQAAATLAAGVADPGRRLSALTAESQEVAA
ncbi:MAG TPA: condensation domain-containing protein [Solirubrobacteraceae bacterium]|jgi:non-ribosomal peptide synthetase component F/acyl carrier protein|nr:condensation domain-containing protein [Solirubrobacteraceae bacterium]